MRPANPLDCSFPRHCANVRPDLRVVVDEAMKIIAVENQKIRRLDRGQGRRTALVREKRHFSEEFPLLEALACRLAPRPLRRHWQ